MNRIIKLTGALLVTAAPLASANADSPAIAAVGSGPTTQVRFGDLNLARPSGRATLDSRIRRAAARLCETAGIRPLADRLDTRQCIAGAVAGARGQVEQTLADYRKPGDAGRAIALRLPR